MAVHPTLDPNQAERLFEGFENLMPFRVNDILLVSSLYDSFILREDGRLNELLMGESLELNLHQVPGITHVSSGAEALELARSQPRFNLIVTNLQVGDMDAAQLAREIKAAGLDVPVIVLAYDYREIQNFIARNPQTDIDRIFLWQGNARILISIVKYIEDKRNVLHDTHDMNVPVMLVVEDDIHYYSLFLPVIYTEIISQSRRLLSEALNVAHKLVRMRARPKILLCSNYEDAEREVTEVSRLPAGRGLGCGVSARGRAYPRGRFRAGAHGTPHRSRRSHCAAIRPHRVHGARLSRGVFLSAEALAHLAGRSAPHSDR